MINRDNLKLYTNAIQTLTAFVNIKLLPELKNISDANKEPNIFLCALFLKTNNALESANLLIANIKSKPQFLDSLFVILRTLMSDLITFDYIFHRANMDMNQLLKEIDNLNYDHLKHTIKNIGVYGKLYGDSQDEIARLTNELVSKNKKYFDADGKALSQYKGLKSIGNMMLELRSQISTKDKLTSLIVAFQNYDKFSKYEHLGGLTALLVTRGYKDEYEKSIAHEIMESIVVVLHYQNLLVSMYFSEYPGLINEYLVFKDRIEKIKFCD